jgi:hypothetical protein
MPLNTITYQFGFATLNPVNGLTTEVVPNQDGTWSLNWTSIFDGQELTKRCLGVFRLKVGAEDAREEFRANERRKIRPASFFIE